MSQLEQARSYQAPSAPPPRAASRLGSLLRLTRLTTGAAAIGNAWFVVLWSDAFAGNEIRAVDAETPALWIRLALAVVCSMGLFAYGAGLNDVLDAKRDRALRPNRPLAGGGIGLEAALAVLSVSLVLAVLGALPLGNSSVLIALAVALGMLGFNAAGRFVPGVGLLMLGLIYAAHMFVFNPSLRFLWPVWVVMTHAIFAGLASHILARRVPRISGRAVTFAVIGWVGASIALYTLSFVRNGESATAGGLWVEWAPSDAWIPPAVVTVVYVLYCVFKIRRSQRPGQQAERVWRYAALFQPFHAAAWLFGAGANLGGVILTALAIASLAGATMLKEAVGLIENPPAFRRQ